MQEGVTLRTHETDGFAFYRVKVHGVQGLLGICQLQKVHVGIAQRAAGDQVPSDADVQHGPHSAELLEQQVLGDVRMEVTHVQGGLAVRGCYMHLLAPHHHKPVPEELLE